jgi:Arc/MetJ-type ribon-helix-helix transcriptional regulator
LDQKREEFLQRVFLTKKDRNPKIVTIKMSPDLLEKIEFLRERLGYPTRSDVIRDSIRLYEKIYRMLESLIPVTYDVRIRDVIELVERILKKECGLENPEKS